MAPFINVHTHHRAESEDIQIIVLNPQEWRANVYSKEELYSVGIHPWLSNGNNITKQLLLVEEALQKENVVALGEIGLDRSIDIPLSVQEAALLPQLELAKSYSKPLIFHAVRSVSDLLSICKQKKVQLPLIIHGFIGKPEAVQQLRNANGYASFGAKIIENRSWDNAIKEAYKLKNIFFETDDANVSIECVYRKASEVLNVDLGELKEQVYSYFCEVLKK